MSCWPLYSRSRGSTCMAWEKATIPWKETSGGKRERVIRVEHGKRALISQLYWRKKRVRPAWTSIVGRRPLLSLCIIAFRSYRLERDKIQVSHDIIKKQLPLRVGGGSPLEWLGEKISRRLTHPVRRPIVLGAFVWLPISLRAVPWKKLFVTWLFTKTPFLPKDNNNTKCD